MSNPVEFTGANPTLHTCQLDQCTKMHRWEKSIYTTNFKANENDTTASDTLRHLCLSNYAMVTFNNRQYWHVQISPLEMSLIIMSQKNQNLNQNFEWKHKTVCNVIVIYVQIFKKNKKGTFLFEFGNPGVILLSHARACWPNLWNTRWHCLTHNKTSVITIWCTINWSMAREQHNGQENK
jgi:hypothetical protein